MARDPRWVRRHLAEDDLAAVTRAIAEAEAATSGEIRVHLERRLPAAGDDGATLARAREVFDRLGMARTRRRNAVLIYLALDDHRLAVIGDEGIHARVGDAYWSRLRDQLVERLRHERPGQALAAVVAEVGRALAEHFPRTPDDTDELSNEVSAS